MFATKADMLARFGSREVVALTDRTNVGVVDDTVMQQGLDAADAEICSYLSGRYVLPFLSVPKPLIGYACDIARFRLTGTEVTCTDDIQSRYDYAVKYLRMVAKGDVTLGVDVTGAQVGGVPAASGIRVAGKGRRFNDDTMAGF
jgi:phage gp36-like protein